MEGSKTIIVKVAKKDVLDVVKTSAYYTGEARKGIDGLLEIGTKMQASSDEDIALADAYEEAASHLSAVLSRCAGPTTFAVETFTVNAQANFNDVITPSLSNVCKSYMTDYVMYKWLTQIKPDEAVFYANKLAVDEKDIRDMASERKKPMRNR